MELNNFFYGKIELKHLNGVMYVEKDNTDTECWNFYDEEKNFIDCLYGTKTKILDDIKDIIEIKNIYDLVDLGLSQNMIFATSLEELLESWNAYIQEDFEDEPFSLEEFEENIPYNKVGQNYFIVNYTEI